MSETGRGRILLMLIGAGAFAFAALLLLSAFGDNWRSGADGGAHALSTAGTGFRAFAALDRAAPASSRPAGFHATRAPPHAPISSCSPPTPASTPGD